MTSCFCSPREDSEASPSVQPGGRSSRSVLGIIGGTVGGIVSLPGRLLRRGGRCATEAGTATADNAQRPSPLTESVLAEKRAAELGAASASSPGAEAVTPTRPAAWEARLRERLLTNGAKPVSFWRHSCTPCNDVCTSCG